MFMESWLAQLSKWMYDRGTTILALGDDLYLSLVQIRKGRSIGLGAS